jgi:DNA-binding SARP family transcriptional activator/Tfp pilus assembly protein PilF
MFYLRTFGGLSLELDGEPVEALAGNRKPLILLAILAADGAVARDRLLALLWPESDTERARGALRQMLHLIRQTLNGGDVVSGTTELRLNPLRIRSDVDDFLQAVRCNTAAAALDLYQGPFLDAVHISNAAEFEHWLDDRREDLRRHYATLLKQQAENAEAQEDFATAVMWWRKRQALDPTDGIVAARLIRALDAAGQRAAALRHAQLHETVLRQEYELPPDPAVAALAREVRARQAPLHSETLERLATRVPALRTRRRTLATLFAAAAIAVLVVAGGMIAAYNISRQDTRVVAATPESQDKARALEYLLKGQQLLQQKTMQATNDAKTYFMHATALDSTLIDAYLGLASTEIAPGLTDPTPRFKRAKEAAERALAIDSTSVGAHTIMLWVKTLYDRDFAAAERHFRSAYQLDPAFPGLFNAYTTHLTTLGRSQEALRVMLRAYELRPDAPANIAYLAFRYVLLNRPAEARRYIDLALARDSSFFMTHWVLGRLHVAAGEYDAALREFSRPGTDLGGTGQQAFIGYTLARAGRAAEARAALDGLFEQGRSGGFVAASDVAIIYIGLGEREHALDWLERLVEQRGQRVFLKTDPIFDPVRDHPRFQRLLAALNIAD